MRENALQVLLIEDDPGDARLIREMLAGGKFEVETRDRLSEGIACLAQGGVDVVLLDLTLPDSSGFDTFARVREHAAGVPIVLLTGLDDETFAIGAVHEGAQDYLNKSKVNAELLTRAIRYAIERNSLIRELQDALARVKTLSGLIPICAWCRKIRNDKGYWDLVESYIESRSDAKFTHGICPDCMVKLKLNYEKNKPGNGG